jgi:hypothetical protein
VVGARREVALAGIRVAARREADADSPPSNQTGVVRYLTLNSPWRRLTLS